MIPSTKELTDLLGPYKILSSLGAGGMGEVYLAQDTRLHRKVALKFLSTNFTQDHERLRRFEQEARAVSALNHPNILTIHEISEVESHRFIATEFIEGQTLRERLRSNLEIDESLEIAIQVASALVAAHRVNIVHRDIKPENIMIRDDGLVKVLDFGLAKMTVPRASIDSGAQTQLRANTTPGVVMGTVAYMSPEQARGGAVDERTDIWSLGVVLYEMVAGCSPFAASTSNEMISAILSKESPPPLTRYSRLVPERLEEIVEKALTKNRDERYQTSKDLLIDLKRLKQSLEFKAGIERSAPSEKSGIASSRGDLNVGMHSESARLTPAIVLPQRRAGIHRAALVWLVACTLGLLLIVVGVITWQRTLRPASTNELEQRQLTANPSEIPLQAAAISPDGKYLVYSDLKGLHLQLIKDGQTQTLSVPEQFVASKVSWLPDGTGILASDEQTGGSSSIWLLSILGGSPRKLRDDAAAPVASPDGSLVAFLGDLEADKAHGIWLMDINGENARRVLSAQSGEQFFRIRWSSEGQRLAYSQSVPGLPGVAVSQTVLGTEVLESVSLNGEAPTAILTRAGLQDFYWLPDGRILFSVAQEDIFGSDSNLWTIRTDNQTGKPTGQPEQITNWAGFSFTDFSSTKDGKRLAFLKLTSQSDVYVGALEQNGTRLKTPWRLTLNERNDWPIEWTSDGRAVVFWSDRNGTWDIFKQRLDQETAEMIPAGTEPKWYAHFSPDGAWFLYMALPKKQMPGGSLPVKIMRVSASGGPPQVVLNATGTTDFRCAHAAMLCVFDEVIGNETVFTSFDPVKGREYEVFREKSRDTFSSAGFALSPDGSRLAIAQFDPQEGRIRLVSLPDRTTSDLVVKGWNRFFEIDWAPDGRGLYVGSNVPAGGVVLYVDLQGQARLLWQQRGNIVTCGRPSPDGRFLAISSWTTNANAWIIENY